MGTDFREYVAFLQAQWFVGYTNRQRRRNLEGCVTGRMEYPVPPGCGQQVPKLRIVKDEDNGVPF